MTVGGRRTRGRRNGPNMEMSCSQEAKAHTHKATAQQAEAATAAAAVEATSDGTVATSNGGNRSESRNIAGLQHIQ